MFAIRMPTRVRIQNPRIQNVCLTSLSPIIVAARREKNTWRTLLFGKRPQFISGRRTIL
jgi:hypothetical protein